jgi:hypothetical protein
MLYTAWKHYKIVYVCVWILYHTNFVMKYITLASFGSNQRYQTHIHKMFLAILGTLIYINWFRMYC